MVNVAAINVLAELGTASWQSRQAVGYETALEGISQAVGYYADLIAQEESAAEPDLATIEACRAEQHAWAARGQEITPPDVKAIESVYDDAEQLLSDDDTEDEDSDDDGGSGDNADDDADDHDDADDDAQDDDDDDAHDDDRG